MSLDVTSVNVKVHAKGEDPKSAQKKEGEITTATRGVAAQYLLTLPELSSHQRSSPSLFSPLPILSQTASPVSYQVASFVSGAKPTSAAVSSSASSQASSIKHPSKLELLDEGLQEWCNKGPPEEYKNRLIAAKRILECYATKNNELDLSMLDLTSLPPEIGQLGELTHLNLSNNNLIILPPQIDQLGQLTSLDLSYNHLIDLPHGINKLTNLTRLNFSDNYLTTFPDVPAGFRPFPAYLPVSASSRESTLRKKALSCAAIRKLYLQAITSSDPHGQIGEIDIQFTLKTSSGFKAESVFHKHRIDILSNVSDDEELTVFVFELTNFVQIEKFYDIFQKFIERARSGEDRLVLRNDFAYEYEKIEFNGTRMHHRVCMEVLDEMGPEWTRNLDTYGSTPSESFDNLWKKKGGIGSTRHAKYYREQWDRIQESLLLREQWDRIQESLSMQSKSRSSTSLASSASPRLCTIL